MAANTISLRFTNPTGLRHEVRDLLPANTTAETIVRELILIRVALDDPAIIDCIETAISDEMEQHYEYLANLRRLYEIALPIVISKAYYYQGAMHQDVHDSLQHLMSEVDWCRVTSIGDKRQVLIDLKRQWRWLGCPTAPYEPLYECLLNKPLRNE